MSNDSPQQATRVKHAAPGKKYTLQPTKTLELKDMIGKAAEKDADGNSITTPNNGLLFTH